ncbi:MAG TPA: hypothetical protein VKS81_00365 [Bacteroidota bacterium]|nr:hypothetical protein [Bacteroidota bacterium]
MTTKPPAKVQEAAAESLEKIAYASVSTIATEEPNDQNRLGYHVWRWLKSKEGTLEQAVKESGSRLHVSTADAVKTISESLKKSGVM